MLAINGGARVILMGVPGRAIAALQGAPMSATSVLDDLSHVLEQPLVFVMIANPKPNHRVAFEKTKNPMIAAHTYRIDRLLVINPPKTQTWMAGVLSPCLAGLPCLSLYVTRKACIMLPELWSSLGSHAGASRSSSVMVISVVWPVR